MMVISKLIIKINFGHLLLRTNRGFYAVFAMVLLIFFQGTSASEPKKENLILKPYQLTKLQAQHWQRAKEDWLKNAYWPCTEKFNLVSDCGQCSRGILLDGVFQISTSGKLADLVLSKKSRACDRPLSKELLKCLLAPLKKVSFAKELWGLQIEDFWGRYLKC